MNWVDSWSARLALLAGHRPGHGVAARDHQGPPITRPRAVAEAALAEFGAVGLIAIMVELSLQLASALERIATEQGIAAVDLADVVRGLTLR